MNYAILSHEVNTMAQTTRHINVSDLQESSAWERLIAEVRATKMPAIIRANGEDAVEVRPVPKRRTRIPAGKVITAGDSLWKIAGMATDEQATDVSENVDKYLAGAYTDTHDA